MLSIDELQMLREQTDIDEGQLADIKNIAVDMEQPLIERMESYQNQIKNPYCFKSGDTVVRLRFTDSGKTIDEGLLNSLTTQKSCQSP